MNIKMNKLGLDISFMDEQDRYVIFQAWMEEAKKTEPNDPNALAYFSKQRTLILQDPLICQDGYYHQTK
jgi:pyridoxine/pyridoxamine 5'-phosphate oxidase|tara:strand:- start:2600 stop:2806 length:207 start_codon:yes stop_codon:yes gene_type:complete